MHNHTSIPRILPRLRNALTPHSTTHRTRTMLQAFSPATAVVATLRPLLLFTSAAAPPYAPAIHTAVAALAAGWRKLVALPELGVRACGSGDRCCARSGSGAGVRGLRRRLCRCGAGSGTALGLCVLRLRRLRRGRALHAWGTAALSGVRTSTGGRAIEVRGLSLGGRLSARAAAGIGVGRGGTVGGGGWRLLLAAVHAWLRACGARSG
jgi:hypothetical protein